MVDIYYKKEFNWSIDPWKLCSMEPNTKVNGIRKLTLDMEMAFRSIAMVVVMKDVLKIANSMALEGSSILTVKLQKDNLKTIKRMDMEFRFMKMVTYIKENF